MLPSTPCNSRVIAGLNPSDSSTDFVQKILSFCDNKPSMLWLAHAQADTFKMPSLYLEALGSFDLTDLDRSGGPSARGQALEKLETIKKSVGNQEIIRTNLCDSEDPALALIELAETTQASLIAIEVEQHLYRFIPSRISVALRLLQKSPIPVLLLRKGGQDPFKKHRRTVLIADDLTEASNSALQQGLALARAWGDAHILHMHVIGENPQRVLSEWKKNGWEPRKDVWGRMDVFDHFRDRTANILKLRASDYLELGIGTYEAIVQYGNVSDRVEVVLKERAPDLAVFGRRNTTPSRPFGIGKVPFAAMLTDSPAVLLVP